MYDILRYGTGTYISGSKIAPMVALRTAHDLGKAQWVLAEDVHRSCTQRSKAHKVMYFDN